MKTLPHTLALLVGFAVSAAALDLTPRLIETDLEGGIKIKELAFSDGTRRVVFQPPHGWRRDVAPGRLIFEAPEYRGLLTIEAETLPAPLTLDAAALERFRAELLRSLPPTAVDAKIVSETPDALNIGSHRSLQLVVDYQTGKLTSRTSIIYLFAETTLLRFTITARAADFEAIEERARGSLHSWRWE